ncbi:MAG: rhamnulokinase [Planctomycetales bacterium]|nr:rhamnulokinase [Planctomycetales bacterium]
MSSKVFLAVDIGASSGRHLAGLFDGKKLELTEIHRFTNGPVTIAGRMVWDLPRQWHDIVEGLRHAGAAYGARVESVGVDTWGVDYALLGRNDELLGNPCCYRDRRTEGMFERAFEIVPRREIFAATGLQFMELNTLYQLLAMRLSDSPLLGIAEELLMMPDLYHWLLSGEKANERTDVSTTQLYDPQTGDWAWDLIDRLELPRKLFGKIVDPGTQLGTLLPQLANDSGLTGAKVVLPGTHDTASAVVAVPAAGEVQEKPDWCYISSGTWSLMGVEVPRPVVTDKCAELNFTNEGGVGGTTRLLKNIAGLWLVQECKRMFSQQGRDFLWGELTRKAAEAESLRSIINPDDERLIAPASMPETIAALCRETQQPVPESDGQFIRCALESLALKYRQVLGWLEELVGGRIETIHIVGGGTQNELLSQMAADACNRRVVAGPIEATALGNVAVQAVAAGAIGSIAEARRVIRESFPVREYLPEDAAPWDEAYERFLSLS